MSRKTGQPLRSFGSEQQALRHAQTVQQLHRQATVPYLCEKCGQWHLSPKDRQTHSVRCDRCRDAGGQFKQLYESEEAARRRAAIIKREKNIYLEVYACPHYQGWHLTSR